MRNAKRLLAALLLAATLIFSSASCGGQTETASEAPAAASSEPQRDYTVQISKDTLRRTGLDITAAAHRLGLTNVTTNDDGSCTVEMTKDERDAVCAALKESLHEQIIALPEDGTWPFIKSVTLSEDGRSAEILSTKDLYKPERDNAAAQAVYIPALLYAAFTGEDANSGSCKTRPIGVYWLIRLTGTPGKCCLMRSSACTARPSPGRRCFSQ